MPLMLDSPIESPEKPTFDLREERRRVHHEADVVVVGAGILGCAIAVALGQQGRSVILLEKSLKEPDRIVGELLQPGGVKALENLGLRDCLEEIDAIVVKGYEVIYYGEEVEISYPEEAAGEGGSKGKRPEGRSFHHGRFIRRLREAAMKQANVTVVETTVTDVVKNGWTGQILGVESSTNGEKDYFFGHLTIIADGYASKFRKEYIKHTPVSKSKFWGLELIDADLPLPLHGHVVLGDGAPILLYQIGTHETRALIDIPENLPSASVANGGVKGHLRNTVLPSLPKCVQSSFEAALDKGALRSMPNSFLPPSTNKTPGMVMLGDAMNMRHPLTGGGMTVAFNDVVLLRDLLSPDAVPDLSDTKAVLRQMSTFHWRRKNLTSVINILAQALYSLFAANDPQLKALQRGCFRYFQRGGQCVDGPVGLLAGIIRQPFVLFYHFFAVALLSIWILLCDTAPALWKLPQALVMSLGVLVLIHHRPIILQHLTRTALFRVIHQITILASIPIIPYLLPSSPATIYPISFCVTSCPSAFDPTPSSQLRPLKDSRPLLPFLPFLFLIRNNIDIVLRINRLEDKIRIRSLKVMSRHMMSIK